MDPSTGRARAATPRLGPQQPQQPQQPIVPFDRFRIVRTEVKGGKRIVGDVKRAVTGKISQEEHVSRPPSPASAEVGSKSLPPSLLPVENMRSWK